MDLKKQRKEPSQVKRIIVTVRMTESEAKALAAASGESGLTKSEILKTALRGVLKGLKKGWEEFELCEENRKAEQRNGRKRG